MKSESQTMATLVELANRLVGDYDVIDVLTVLSHRSADAVDVDAAGIIITSPIGELQFVASSRESVRTLTLFQVHANEGPGVVCVRNGLAVTNEALNDTGGRWPMFAPQAIAQGFHGVLAVPMRLRGRTIGALVLFRAEQGSLSEVDMVVAQCLADVATIAVQQHQSTFDASTSNTQLSSAINSRVVIEQAVGMIRQATSCSRDDAFERLRAHAAHHNEGLTVIARRLVGKSIDSNDLDEWGSRPNTHAVTEPTPVDETSLRVEPDAHAPTASNLVIVSAQTLSLGNA
jgi:GAF domain-containing protein